MIEDQTTQNTGGGSDGSVSERVDRVIADVLGGRVAPRKVDELADATARSQRDRKVGQAVRRK